MAAAALIGAMIGLESRARGQDMTPAVLRQFGLEGIWSPDCSRPASSGNPRAVWDVPEPGPVLHSVTYDMQAFSPADTISDAVLLSGRLLQFAMGRGIAPSVVVTVERAGARIRTVSAVGMDGREYYADGVEVATGKPSVAYERCRDGPPGS